MTTGTSETDTHYAGLIKGGYWASVLGSASLLAITVTNLTSKHRLDVSLMILAGVSCVVGALLILATLILRQLDEHKADHATATFTVDDVHRIEQYLAILGAQVGGLREMVAHCDIVAAPEKFEAAAAKAASAAAVDVARASWAAGAVDVMDGMAAVIPISQAANGSRPVPPQRDQPRQS